MTLMGRSIIRSDGYTGAPGYNILHWTGGLGAGPASAGGVEEFHDNLEAMLTDLVGSLAAGATWTVEAQCLNFDDSDGVLIGAVTDPSGDRVVTGTGAGTDLPRSSCYTVRLRTDEFVNGRRLQGRIFVGPVSSIAFDTGGQVPAGNVAVVEPSFDGLISGLGGRLAVWHRPTTAIAADGSYGDVTSVVCNTVPGTLRSRNR